MIRATVCLCLILAPWVWASNEDYKIEIAKERAAKERGAPARIWSKRCQRQGKDVLATKADKGPWKIRCIERRTLQVKA